MTGYYCVDFCRYEYRPNNKVAYVGPCKVTGKEVTVVVDEYDIDKWMDDRMHIQNAFPYLKAWEREFLLNGYSEEGWTQTFGTDEEEEDDSDESDTV